MYRPSPAWRPSGNPTGSRNFSSESDVVVIGLPLTKATHHLFTRDLFRQMRRHAILINVTRGAIVYGEDLLKAI